MLPIGPLSLYPCPYPLFPLIPFQTFRMSETAVDELLISQIRRGDEAAWRELIARYEGRLLGYVEQRLRHRAASEDIVQETFVGFLLSCQTSTAIGRSRVISLRSRHTS